MRTARLLFFVIICAAALLSLSGCGTGTALPASLPPTVTFTANPTVIPPNGSTVLTWSSTAATSVSIDQNLGTVAASGQVSVKPAQTTTYTITATGAGGSTKASVTVTVSASATTVLLTATPAAVVSGGASVLTATATNATSVIITNNVDSKTVTLPGAGGTSSVSPLQTTIYTATATGASGSVTATATVSVLPTVTITATPATLPLGGGSTVLTVTATNATSVVISDNLDSITYPLAGTGGTQNVTLTKNTIYTATATNAAGPTTASVTVTIAGTVGSVKHVLFLMQENRSFDTYFGMLNPYRKAQSSPGASGAPQPWNVGDDGNIYNVDGIDDNKLATTVNKNDEGAPFNLFHTTTTCLDDMTSSWFESYGDVNTFGPYVPGRPILMDGFVHTAENFAKSNLASGGGSGSFTDTLGKRAMAYYTEKSVSGAPELNYYYYMASQFALSDRWFSPVSSKSTPNRIATMTGGTTQGLVRDPFVDDKLTPLLIPTIFEKLDNAAPAVSWRIYYSLTGKNQFPATTFSDFNYSGRYLYTKNPANPACTGTTQDSATAVGDVSNSFCIDLNHIAPISQLFTDMANGTLPAFSYIEANYGVNDEHPGSGQSILTGQAQVAKVLNAFMNSASSPLGAWADSIFFLSFDEGGGPYDHVPPVPGHSNDQTTIANMGFLPSGGITDISTIAVNSDTVTPYFPCLANGPVDPITGNPTATLHCDLKPGEPGTATTDAPAVNGFAAQLGFRLPNIVISPFSRKHYVSHVPMDHTAVIRFVEDRFIGNGKYLTNRDAAQPPLLDFFDFTAIPWSTPPPIATIPVPPDAAAAVKTCNAGTMQ